MNPLSEEKTIIVSWSWPVRRRRREVQEERRVRVPDERGRLRRQHGRGVVGGSVAVALDMTVVRQLVVVVVARRSIERVPLIPPRRNVSPVRVRVVLVQIFSHK